MLWSLFPILFLDMSANNLYTVAKMHLFAPPLTYPFLFKYNMFLSIAIATQN